MAYSENALKKLRMEYAKAPSKLADLTFAYTRHEFQKERAREYASHGYLRRLNTVFRCLKNVFILLPPDRIDVPSKDELTDATINIQAFMFNAFGCIDNLAWIWVYETDITRPNGKPLTRNEIGLAPKCINVRNSLSDEFRAYLDSIGVWFKEAGEYRDALAHRVPLYIPYMVHKRNQAEFQRLSKQMARALGDLNFTEHSRLEAEQQQLLEFRPEMTHSLSQAGTVLFHPQMLADYGLIIELGQRMLRELRR